MASTTAPRGATALPTTVGLYKLLYEAGRPLTFREISDGLKRAHSAWQNDANRAYLASGIEAVKYLTEDRDYWETHNVYADAWEWWVGQLVGRRGVPAILNGNIIAEERNGGPLVQRKQYTLDEKRWRHNPDKPPTIRTQPIVIGGTVYKPDRASVLWSPESDDAAQRQITIARVGRAIEASLRDAPKAKRITIDRAVAEAILTVIS